MRPLACPGLLLLVVVLGAGCDSDQPLEVGERTVDLAFDAPSALINAFNVWDLKEISCKSTTTNQPCPVSDDVTMWCEAADPEFASSVPWTYSVVVSVLRAGEVVAVPLSSPEALEDGTNVAGYDTNKGKNNITKPNAVLRHDRGACSGDADIACNPTSTSTICAANAAGVCEEVYSCSGDFDTLCDPMGATCADMGLGACILDVVERRFNFDTATRRVLSAANRSLLQADSNGIYAACVGGVCLGAPTVDPELGLCPGDDVGDPQIDGNVNPPLFSLTLNKGDTVIVEAKRFDTEPNIEGIEFTQEPVLRAAMFVDGQQLQADEVQGNLATQANSTSSISFFFTSK